MIIMKITIVKNKDYKQLAPIYKNFKTGPKGDLCMAVGGDGTFVRAAKEYQGPILPIRSGEEGSIGYYADLSIKDIPFVIRALKNKAYTIEKLENKLEVIYKGKSHYAVNEVLLRNVSEEVSFKICEVVGGKRRKIYPYIMSGDGMIITSSIGSTAYNKSAGGPIILMPDAMCLTFLNVDGPYRNPIVVDCSKVLEIEIIKYSGMLLYDGINVGKVKPGDKFRIRVSQKELKIVRFKEKREELAKKLDRIIKSRMIR